MASFAGPNNIRDNLAFYIDASNPKSYTGTNTSWTDLIGGKVLTASNSPAYQSDGSFYFTGTASPSVGSYFRDTSASNNITGSVTLNSIIAPTYNTGPHKTVICTDTNYPYGVKLMSYKNSGRYGLWIGFGGSVSLYPGGYEAFVNVDINDGTKKMITGVWDQTNGIAKMYLNGSLTGTFNVGVYSQVLYDGYTSIGVEYHAFGSGPYQGKIYQASIHTKAMSDAEVKQMYDIFSRKYGI